MPDQHNDSRKQKIVAILKGLGLLENTDKPYAVIEDTLYILEGGKLVPKHHLDEADLIAS
jgi:hypothetical protein